MHELSLCGAIADTALAHANGRPVEGIRLRVGHFRQVVPETLQFCWNLRSEGTALAGCLLEVDYIPVVIRCSSCHRETELAKPILECSACEGRDVAMISGDEFLIDSIDLGPTPASAEKSS